MHASADLLTDGHIVQHFWCCNLSNCCRSAHFFHWNESEHVVLPINVGVEVDYCVSQNWTGLACG